MIGALLAVAARRVKNDRQNDYQNRRRCRRNCRRRGACRPCYRQWAGRPAANRGIAGYGGYGPPPPPPGYMWQAERDSRIVCIDCADVLIAPLARPALLAE